MITGVCEDFRKVGFCWDLASTGCFNRLFQQYRLLFFRLSLICWLFFHSGTSIHIVIILHIITQFLYYEKTSDLFRRRSMCKWTHYHGDTSSQRLHIMLSQLFYRGSFLLVHHNNFIFWN